MGVQACRLPGLQRLKGLKPLKLCKRFSERPTAQTKATPRPHPWLLLCSPACRSRGITRFKPFKRLNILLACLLPQPTGTPRRHQWLLMGVQAGRLPALKRLKGLKPLKLCKRISERTTAQAKATPRPQPWLLLSGPACRSRGVTRFKPFKRLNILLACLLPQPTGTPRRHQWLRMGVQEPPSFHCHRCQTPTSCAFRFSETRRAAWRLAAEMTTLTTPPKEEGVGGTRALAHSIYQCFWMVVCKKTM